MMKKYYKECKGTTFMQGRDNAYTSLASQYQSFLFLLHVDR